MLELGIVGYDWSAAGVKYFRSLQLTVCMFVGACVISHQLQGLIKLRKIIQLCSIISLHCCITFNQFEPNGIRDRWHHYIFIILLASLFLSGMWIITTLLLFLLRFFFPSFLQVPTESKTHLSSLKLDGSSEDRE